MERVEVHRDAQIFTAVFGRTRCASAQERRLVGAPHVLFDFAHHVAIVKVRPEIRPVPILEQFARAAGGASPAPLPLVGVMPECHAGWRAQNKRTSGAFRVIEARGSRRAAHRNTSMQFRAMKATRRPGHTGRRCKSLVPIGDWTTARSPRARE
eukprot:scaffold11075_cov132-Isochrysis_galbana.AAC.10